MQCVVAMCVKDFHMGLVIHYVSLIQAFSVKHYAFRATLITKFKPSELTVGRFLRNASSRTSPNFNIRNSISHEGKRLLLFIRPDRGISLQHITETDLEYPYPVWGIHLFPPFFQIARTFPEIAKRRIPLDPALFGFRRSGCGSMGQASSVSDRYAICRYF